MAASCMTRYTAGVLVLYQVTSWQGGAALAMTQS